MKVIGASRSPTPYKITGREEEYVRCGADILLNAVGRDLEGESNCVVCGGLTRVQVVQGKVTLVDPVGAVLHVVELRGKHGTEIVCEGSPMFDREACLQVWLASYKGPPGRVFKLPDYMPHASELVAARVKPAQPESSGRSNPKIAMLCADCGCSPIECAESISATDCPNCRLESCCCWTPSGIA